VTRRPSSIGQSSKPTSLSPSTLGPKTSVRRAPDAGFGTTGAVGAPLDAGAPSPALEAGDEDDGADGGAGDVPRGIVPRVTFAPGAHERSAAAPRQVESHRIVAEMLPRTNASGARGRAASALSWYSAGVRTPSSPLDRASLLRFAAIGSLAFAAASGLGCDKTSDTAPAPSPPPEQPAALRLRSDRRAPAFRGAGNLAPVPPPADPPPAPTEVPAGSAPAFGSATPSAPASPAPSASAKPKVAPR
jgi:hypothetical protein